MPLLSDEDWVSRLQLCGFINADDFDGAILDSMQCGYVEGSLEVFNASGKALGLQEAASLIVQNEHWDDGIVPAFLRAEPDQLVHLLREHQGPDLQRLVTGIFRLQAINEEREAIRVNMVSALKAIGQESPLNAIRVARWGVTDVE